MKFCLCECKMLFEFSFARLVCVVGLEDARFGLSSETKVLGFVFASLESASCREDEF